MAAFFATLLASLETFLAIYDIVKRIVSFMERKKWIDEGKAQVWREQLEDMEHEAAKARAARAAVKHDSRSVHDDPDNRDRDANG